MDESLEVSGRTVEEAIESGLRQLGISRDVADVVVLSRGRTGILGIGSEQARVRISARETPVVEPDDAANARAVLEKLLHYMGVAVTVEIISQEGQTPILLDVHGEDAGLLIGRRGATLQDLQSVVTTMVSRSLKRYVPLRVDVEGYRERRMDKVRQIALRAADHVQQRRRPLTLDPMTAAERRMVHTTLSDNPSVMTQSSGDGEERRVTIYPRGGAPRPGAPIRPGIRPVARPGYGGARPGYGPATTRPGVTTPPPKPSPSDFPPDDDEDEED